MDPMWPSAISLWAAVVLAVSAAPPRPDGAAGRTKGIRLPPFAVVRDRDETGAAWRESGEITGSLEVASGRFRSCLGGQGWRLDKAIPLARRGAHRSQLTLFRRGSRELFLMLWQQAPGVCGFAWRIEKKTRHFPGKRIAPGKRQE